VTGLRPARGRGLIEFVAATTLGVLLIAGAWTLYVQNEQPRRAAAPPARAEDALRAAFAAIESDLRMAGEWGLTARSSFIAGAAAPSDPPGPIDAAVENDCGPNFVANLGQPVEARARYDLECAGTRPASWADVLIVRRAGLALRSAEDGRVQLSATRQGGALSIVGGTGRVLDAAAVAETHDLSVSAYYIGEDARVRGERHWTLRRQTLTNRWPRRPAMVDEALVPDVADLRLLLGVDTDGDGAVDVYVRPGAAELASGRVVSVRLSLTALADAASGAAEAVAARDGPPQDGRRRLVLERTAALRNAGGR
jgi:Tfp pilus assembly protein PilW